MMITRHEGHGSFTKQFLKEGSMGSIMKVNHLHSPPPYSSVEILSPRSVLEQQRSLSGLAIAIDLEEKMKFSPQTQENVILGRFLSKQNIMQMSTPEAQGKGNLTVGRFFSREKMFLSRERLSHMKHEEREAFTDELTVGLKMIVSLQQMNNQELDKAEDKVLLGRSLSRERMREMMHKSEEKKEREALSGGSNGVLMVGASLGEEREQDNACVSGKLVVRSADDHLLQSPLAAPSSSSCRRASCKCGQRSWWLHELGHVQQNFPACASSMEDSIFYYAAATNPPPPSSTYYHRRSLDYGSPVEDFLQCCYSCKCRLGAGKDIYMYRGDQAFCSVECRYEQIAKDECMGA